MTQQERIELLNRDLKELADLMAGMKECQVIPEIFLNMARDKALRMAEGFELLAREERIKEVEVMIPAQPEKAVHPQVAVEPVKVPEPAKPAEPAKPTEPIKPVEPAKPVEVSKPAEPRRIEPMPVKEAFSSVFKEFTHTPVSSAAKSDLRSLLTLNDRFLFQRELFRGDIGMLNFTLDKLNSIATMEEAVAFLQKEYHWDEEAAGVKEFMELLERHYTGTII